MSACFTEEHIFVFFGEQRSVVESGSNTQILAHTKVQQSDLMLLRTCLGSFYVEHETDFYLFCALEYPRTH